MGQPFLLRRNLTSFYTIGSTTYIVPPLTTIEAQLLSECDRLGIHAVAGSQAIIVLI